MAKVLVVDHDADILQVVDVLLTMKGFTVNKLSSAKKVVEEVQSFKPDVILLDIHPGGQDGRQICLELKSPGSPFRHIPVILFSTMKNIIIEYPECEAIDFVPKPFDAIELVEKIKKLTNAAS